MFDVSLPQLRIAGPKCSLVRTNEIREGTWFLSYPGGDFENFPDGIRITIDAFQMKAIDWIVRPPVVSTDKNSPCYKAIQLRSDKDNGGQCLWGPEYQVRIQGLTRALLYLGNKSSRNLMSSIRIGGKYMLFPQKRTHGEFTWYVPNLVDVSQFDTVKPPQE